MSRDSIPLHPKYGLNATVPICVFCGEKKNQVALLGNKYKEEAPSSMVVDLEPCEKCQEMMNHGLTIIEVEENAEYPIPHSWAVIQEDHIEELLANLTISDREKDFIRKYKKMYANIGFIKHITGETNGNKD